MATIRKRTWTSGADKRTAWIVDYRDQAGKRRLKTFATKKEADAYLVKARYEVSQGTHTADADSVTVAEAAELWIKRGENEDLERSTLRQYRQHVDLHIAPLIGGVKLSRLTAPRVQEFADKLLETRSRALARKIMTSLKSLISEAERRGLVSQNVARVVSIRTPTRHKVRAVIPSKEEIRTLVSSATGRWRPIIITAILTGMRSSELRGLTWADVDFDAEMIRVRQRADAWGDLGSPKSAAGRRDIPMAPLVLNTLREWKLACPKGDLNLVFPNGRGGIESHANIVNRGFGPLQIACGIVDQKGRPKYGLHALRHFCASWLIEQDFTPKRVQTILGHSSITMTYDTYGHLFPSPEDDHAKLAAGELAVIG